MAATGKELLFNAWVTRFNASATWKAVGRKLAMTRESTKPWTEFQFLGSEQIDGFGDDIELHTIRFIYHGKSPTIAAATNWLERVTEFADDYTGLSVSGYTVGGVERLSGDDGPHDTEGIWDAQADYRVMMHRSSKLPAVRGS